MSTSSNEPDRQSDPPAATAVRPAGARSTVPGHSTLPGPGPRAEHSSGERPRDDLGLDSTGTSAESDTERALADSIPPPEFTVDVEPMEAAEAGEAEDLTRELDSSDVERVTLVDLPSIARYGNYELLGRIAYGGMAEIFLSRELGHQDTRRMMVVKRVLPHVAEDRHFVDMFIDEARLAMHLNHPNVCHVYNFGEAEGTYYIAMEWVNGKPLSKIIRRAREQGGLPIPIALKIIAQVAEALDYAHRASDSAGEPLGIVHRDVSPQNVMVSYDGVVKLLDFGIAKATSHSTRTEAGIIKGKFAYMSPQQCVGEPIDARADIFALGICLFETLTGKNPFRRKTEFETMTRIVGDATPSVQERRPEVPDAIAEVVDRSLMKQPELRYQSAGDMQLAIEQVIPTLGVLVNSSRVGEYITQLFADEVREGPQLDTRLALPPQPVGQVGSNEDSLPDLPRRVRPGATEVNQVVPEDYLRAERAKADAGGKRGLAGLAIALLLLALVGTGGALAWTLLGARVPAPVADSGGASGEATNAVGREPARPADLASADVASADVPSADVPRPDAPAMPIAMTGSVFLESDPPGATVAFGDRDPAGLTPLELGSIVPGEHTVRMSLDGHDDWTGRVVVRPGVRAAVMGALARHRDRAVAGPPGQLSLNTRPWSKVYVGRRLLGTTPIGGAQVPSGTVRLRLVDRDGNEHRRALRVPAGGHVTESYDLR